MDMSWLVSALIVVVVLLAGVAWVGDWIRRRADARRYAHRDAHRAVLDAQRAEEVYRSLAHHARELIALPLWFKRPRNYFREAGSADPDEKLDEQRAELVDQMERAAGALVLRPATVRDTAADLAAAARSLGELCRTIHINVPDEEHAEWSRWKPRHEEALAALRTAHEGYIAAVRADLGVGG